MLYLPTILISFHLFVQLFAALSSLSPSPPIRSLAFKLLSTVTIRSTTKDEIQLMIISDLIKDCPHEQMRVAVIGLLRELLVTKFAQVSNL